MKKFFLMFNLLIFFVGCNPGDQGPEATLKKFIDSRLGNKVEREFIFSNSTGKLKKSLLDLPDQELKRSLDLRGIKNGKLKILSKSCQKNLCYLTYSISFDTVVSGKKIVATDVKKIAEMTNQEGKWLISDVTNIKTYHEILSPINP